MLTVDFACSNCQFIETLLGGFLIVLEESFSYTIMTLYSLSNIIIVSYILTDIQQLPLH